MVERAQPPRMLPIDPENFGAGLELIMAIAADLEALLEPDNPSVTSVDGHKLLQLVSRMNYVSATLVTDMIEAQMKLKTTKPDVADPKVQ